MSNLIKSKENHLGQDSFSSLTTWGSFLGSRDRNRIQSLAGYLDNVDQNKNIIFICKLFTSVPLRSSSKEEILESLGDTRPLEQKVKNFEPYVEQRQIQGELPGSLKPLSVRSGSLRVANRPYASYSDWGKSKKYALLQSLLTTQTSTAPATLASPQPVTKQFHETNLTSSARKIQEGWGRKSSSFKNVSFLTYWLLPFMSLVPFVAARSIESYGGLPTATVTAVSKTNLKSADGPLFVYKNFMGRLGTPEAYREADNNNGLEDSSQKYLNLGAAKQQRLTGAEGSTTHSLSQNFYLKKVIIGSNSSEEQSSIKAHEVGQSTNFEDLKTPPADSKILWSSPNLQLKQPSNLVVLNPNSKNVLAELKCNNSNLLDSRNRYTDETFTLLTNSDSQKRPPGTYQKANYNYVPLQMCTGGTDRNNLSLTGLKVNIALGENLKAISSETQNLRLQTNVTMGRGAADRPHFFGTTYQNYLKYIRKKLILLAPACGNANGLPKLGGSAFSSKQQNIRPYSKIWAHVGPEARHTNTEASFSKPFLKTGRRPVLNIIPTSPRGNYVAQPNDMSAANSINIVVNQKKLYVDRSAHHNNKVTEGQLKWLRGIASDAGDTKVKSKQDQKVSYFLQKKEIEKKRKAKKLRLESRRQKKRKRFYPRPTWLRLRLKLDSVRQAGAVQFKQIKMGHRPILNSAFFGMPEAHHQEQQTRWHKALNLTTYNKFLYNLAFSIKDSLHSYTTNSKLTVEPFTKSSPQDANDTAFSQNNVYLNLDDRIGSSLKGRLHNTNLNGNTQMPDSMRTLKQNLTSNYKLENQKLAEFLYTRKLELTRKSLGKIKSKSNYINFEPKSANQTIPKKETNSSLYRDFWLWLYNTTSTNTYNKTLLLDNFLTHMSVPLTIQGKTSSKGLNLWLPAQLSNKSGLTVVPWAINKTNLQTTTNKRLSLWSIQKLRNQSKNNKTKWIQKQIQTKVNNFLSPSILKDIWSKTSPNSSGSNYSLETSGILKKSLIFKIRQKIHQKEQKLGYLVNQVYADHLSGYYLSNLSTHVSGPSGAGAYQKDRPNTKKRLDDGDLTSMYPQSQKPVHKIGQNLYSAKEAVQSKASTNLTWWENFSSISSFKDVHNNLNNLIEPTTFNTKNSKSLNNAVWLGLLVHFCALISLISISQIRCFIKFHFILIHKLSNNYLSLLYKITNSLSGVLNQKEPKSFNFGVLGSARPRKKENLLLPGNLLKPKALTIWAPKAHMDKKDSGPFGANKKLEFYQARGRSALKGVKLRTDKAQVLSTYSSNAKNLRMLLTKQNLILQTFPDYLGAGELLKQKSPLQVGGVQSERERRSNFQDGPTAHLKWFYISPNLQSSNYQKLLTQTFKIQTLAKQNQFIELVQYVTKTSKKSALDTGFKVVDTFESCLRLIYGFFEKPAEFTMDWIAYAFLVEWSSDLLSFTPQKTETQNWLAFSKTVRQTKVGFVWYSNVTNTNPLILLPTILLTQFISKRFLYLNDLFLSVLYKPDTDLLIRQKKGTLFWDIWSDFLIKAADKYNINIPSLSNIKEEQNLLLENFLADTSFKNQDGPTVRLNVTKTAWGAQRSLENKSLLDPIEANRKLVGGATHRNIKYFKNLSDGSKHPSQILLENVGFEDEPLSSSWNDKSLAKSFNLPNTNNRVDSENVAQQFITYQSKETDLFLDYNAPKSFNSLSSIKYYSLIQQPLGTIVCQIYSGLLTQQIAKNILVIGSTLSSNSKSGSSALENSQKTLLIQALAGETEIKIITDNASRYAIVNKGFAVGIKYLKEVFDAITLNTPCVFLLEDIHLIGERRPQLISDHGDSIGSSDGMNKSIDAAFGSARSGDAVHEKNQIYYQLSRHAITHYKKPFKGDFSLAIPTNHFSFDLFLKSRPNNFMNNPSSTLLTHPLSHGINIFDPEQKVDKANQAGPTAHLNLNTKLSSKRSLLALPGSNSTKEKLSTSELLKLSNNTLLAPPSTSPFSVLLLKEQKKLKATKIVKEIPWVGLPTEQLSLLPRVSYSVRAKVSALAELGFTNMSAKLDMITDLLVIIDSVRSHRGFVVFATTHLPHLLDPALRRPGRLDETISIPTISNLWTRWEFSKSSINSIYLNSVGNARLGMPKAYREAGNSYFGSLPARIANPTFQDWVYNTGTDQNQKNKINTKYLTNGVTGYVGTYTMMDFFNLDFAANLNNNFFSPIAHSFTKMSKDQTLQSTLGLTSLEGPRSKYSTKVSHIAYYQMGKKLLCWPLRGRTRVVFGMPRASEEGTPTSIFKISNLTPSYLNPTISDSTNSISEINEMILNYGPEALKYKSFYSSPRNIQNILIGLMSGKFTELFAFKSFTIPTNSTLNFDPLLGIPESSLSSPKTSLYNYKTKLQQNFISLYGIDETWRAATSFALSFVQKRYLFNKNLIVPKLLNLGNFSSLEEAPSPPAANILIPAKRYENYKKSFKENIKALRAEFKLAGLTSSNLQSKLQNHMKQAFIKNIYSRGTGDVHNLNQTTKTSALVSEEYLKTANNSLLKLAAADFNRTLFIQSTNASVFYENKIYYRHRLSLNNQWWTAQLTEHSAETLFLSDIDWRYTFIGGLERHNQDLNSAKKSGNSSKLGVLEKLKANQNTFFKKLGSNLLTNLGAGGASLDPTKLQNSGSNESYLNILIDFPDADQLYNPKQRRWTITSGYWSSWFNLDKSLQNEIFDSLIFESVMNIYEILNNNREMLDYSAAKFIKKGLIKESEITNLLNSFSNISTLWAA